MPHAWMLALAALCLIFTSMPARAQATAVVHEGYNDFYASQPGAVFGKPLDIDTRTIYSYEDRPGMYVDTSTSINGVRVKLEVGQDRVVVNGRSHRFAQARTFKGERAIDIYPATASVFIADGGGKHPAQLCVEGSGSGAGEASRHIQVYLLSNPLGVGGKPRMLHLPSLLSSCRAVVANDSGELAFPKNTYLTDAQKTARTGLLLSYQTFLGRHYGRFAAAERKPLRLTFVEADNPFRFVVDDE